MGYFYLLCIAVMFSFGGTYVKLIRPYFGPEYITFFRFAVGVAFLLLLRCFRQEEVKNGPKPEKGVKSLAGWILFGAVAKWLGYLLENYALSQGPSYGNIVLQPVQTVTLTLFGVFLLKETLSLRKRLCILLCVAGVLLISWNGRSLEVFFRENAVITLIFVLSGISGASHILAQRMIVHEMNIIDANLSIFAISGVLAAIPLIPKTLGGALAGVRPSLPCFIAIFLFGMSTGLGFYLNAKAIPLVPFYMVGTIQNTLVIFAIIWGALFFQETITLYVIGGTALFLTGLLGLQLHTSKKFSLKPFFKDRK